MKTLLLALALLASVAHAGPRYDVDVIGGIDMEAMASAYIQLLDTKGPEVSVRINSPGGNPMAVLLFIDLARDAKVEKKMHVTCVATMMAASAAFLLLESDFCDVRQAEPATILLAHEASMRSGDAEKPNEMEDSQNFLRVLNRVLAAVIAPRIGMTVDGYLAWIAGHDRALAPDQALELGMLDRVALWLGHAGEKVTPVEPPN
jgi:ATP-dependent protease ClpP protease subunit